MGQEELAPECEPLAAESDVALAEVARELIEGRARLRGDSL